MGLSSAPIPPLKAAQGHRVVEKRADVASPHCGPYGIPASHDRISQQESHTASTVLRLSINANCVSRPRAAWRGHVTLHSSKYLSK
eukprot:272424-Prymnesium_polylepis.2